MLCGIIAALSSTSGYLLLLTIAAGALWIFMNRRKPTDMPGPTGFPLVGYIPFMGSNPVTSFTDLAKKYGSVYSLRMGEQNLVILSSYEAVKEAFSVKGHIFSGRPHTMFNQFLRKGQEEIIMTDGILWKEARKFTVVEMKKFGIGKSENEIRIMEEIDYFLKAVEQHVDTVFDLQHILGRSVCNNICLFSLGKRFEYDDPKFVAVCKAIEKGSEINRPAALDLFFPTLMNKIPGAEKLLTDNHQLRSCVDQLTAFAREVIKEHKKNHQVGKETDFIDHYLTQMKSQNVSQEDIFTERSLEGISFDMVAAGLETTTSSLMWTLLYLICHPDIQRKVQREIEQVIGRERTPSVDDKLQMPYTEAVILESMRHTTIVPMGVPHRAREDSELCGYAVSKESIILSNLWAIHHDEKTFPDPMSFRPERFLDAHGQISRSANLVPFSTGKRVCIGESLARTEIFLYLTSMLQHFTFSNPPGQTLTTQAMQLATSISPQPFKVKVTKNNN